LQEIRQAAEFLDLPELLVFVSNIQSHEEFLNTDLKKQYRKVGILTYRDNLVHQN
jgi:Rho-related BTB domain-containing protein 1/2